MVHLPVLLLLAVALVRKQRLKVCIFVVRESRKNDIGSIAVLLCVSSHWHSSSHTRDRPAVWTLHWPRPF